MDDPLGCTRDAEGRCVEIDPCGLTTPAADDRLSEAAMEDRKREGYF